MSQGATSEDTLLTFPCQFPIKIMGRVGGDLELAVVEIVQRHVELTPSAVAIRHSQGGNYLAVTITIEAHSKPQLDAIYQDLSGHPLVLMVL